MAPLAQAMAGSSSLPEPDTIDWGAVLQDIAVQQALLEARTLILRDEDDAIIALLLAA